MKSGAAGRIGINVVRLKSEAVQKMVDHYQERRTSCDKMMKIIQNRLKLITAVSDLHGVMMELQQAQGCCSSV